MQKVVLNIYDEQWNTCLLQPPICMAHALGSPLFFSILYHCLNLYSTVFNPRRLIIIRFIYNIIWIGPWPSTCLPLRKNCRCLHRAHAPWEKNKIPIFLSVCLCICGRTLSPSATSIAGGSFHIQYKAFWPSMSQFSPLLPFSSFYIATQFALTKSCTYERKITSCNVHMGDHSILEIEWLVKPQPLV